MRSTELEFKSLAAQGYNRIPLIAEAFADLETPLSLYLKLAQRQRRRQAQLPARVGRRRRALRPLLVHRPAGAHAAARAAASRTEVVTDGEVVETHEGNPLDFIAAYQQRFKVALRPGPAALLRRPRRLLRLRHGAPHRAEAGADARQRRTRIGTPDILLLQCRGAGGHRQPVGQAVPDRLRRSGAARGLLRAPSSGCASCADKLRYSVDRAGGAREPVAPASSASSPRTTTWPRWRAPRNTSPPAT